LDGSIYEERSIRGAHQTDAGVGMKLYHLTSAAAAQMIVTSGFRNATAHYLTAELHSGVWLSDIPLDNQEGADGDTLLEVDIGDLDLRPYEWIEQGRIGFREWLVPAQVLNQHARTRLLSAEESAAAEDAGWAARFGQ
jgi:hypothetical protein